MGRGEVKRDLFAIQKHWGFSLCYCLWIKCDIYKAGVQFVTAGLTGAFVCARKQTVIFGGFGGGINIREVGFFGQMERRWLSWLCQSVRHIVPAEHGQTLVDIKALAYVYVYNT